MAYAMLTHIIHAVQGVESDDMFTTYMNVRDYSKLFVLGIVLTAFVIACCIAIATGGL